MLKNIARSLGLLLLIAGILPALAADPTAAQIYQAAHSGHLAQAQQMIGQVLRDHPQSARAHYVAAQINARAGRYDLARQELSHAEALAPGLPTVDSQALQQLKLQLDTHARAAMPVPPTVRSHGVRLEFVFILIAAAALLWWVLRRRAAAMGYRQYPGSYPGSVPPGGPLGPGYGPGGGPGGYMPGGGSGLMGSVASGLAVGAGVVAGEELVRHLANGSSANSPGVVSPAEAAPAAAQSNGDMGGNDFGLNDSASWDDGSAAGGDEGGGGDWT